MYESDMLKKAMPIYKGCPMCGHRSWLKVREVSWFSLKECLEHRFSIRCESCNLVFGEFDGVPQYATESALIADWNRRAY